MELRLVLEEWHRRQRRDLAGIAAVERGEGGTTVRMRVGLS
jgi:hypothetical protein